MPFGAIQVDKAIPSAGAMSAAAEISANEARLHEPSGPAVSVLLLFRLRNHLGLLLSRMGSKKMRMFIAKINGGDLLLLKDLLETGKIVPVIDRRYPLGEVAEAVRYCEEGHAQGKVVIVIQHSS